MLNTNKLGTAFLIKAAGLFIASLLLSPKSMASDVTFLFRSANASAVDFNAYSKLYPEQKAFANYLKEKGPSKVLVEKVKSQFVEAQKSYLQDPIHVANNKWKNMVTLMHSSDWANSEKEIFVISLLRLAQSDSQNAHELVRRAIGFYSNYIPSPDLFPPTITELWNDLKKNSPSIRLSLHKWKKYDILLLNSEPYTLPLEKQIQIKEGFHRFTFLSHSQLPVTVLAQAKDIEAYEPNNESLILGDCDAPRLNSNTPYLKNIKKYHVVFADCIAENPAISKDNSPQTFQMGRPKLLADETTNGINQTIQNDFNSEKSVATPFYQKKAFWYGVAAFAAASLVIEQNNNSKESSENTRRSGW